MPDDPLTTVKAVSACERAALVLAFREANAPNNKRFCERALLVDNGGRGSDQKALTFDGDDLSALMFDHRALLARCEAAEHDLAAERIENTHLRAAFVTMERAANQHEAEAARLREAAQALMDYQTAGAPAFDDWDAKFDALKAALDTPAREGGETW